MSTDPSAKYRWLNVKHHDLDFWGIAGKLPWPAEDSRKAEPGAGFPFVRLLEGIERLRAAGREWDERWAAVETFLRKGDELGDVLERSDFPAVLRILDELDVLRPGTAYCAFNRAFVLRAQGKTQEALAAATLAVERAPRLEYLWMRRGNLHEELGDEKSAIFCFRKALGLLPRHAQALDGLARLGAMKKLTLNYDDGTHVDHYYTPDEFRREVAANMETHAPDHPRLRSLLRQFGENRAGAEMLLVLDRILEGDPADALRLRVQRAEALRLLKRRKEAEAALAEVLAESPNEPEALYVRAWCHFDAGRNDEGWDGIREVLRHDPNHQKAIQVRFRLNPENMNVAMIDVVEKWAERKKSWRGYWLAAIHASMLEEREAELRCAEAAYRLAPQERDAVFFYASSLNNMDEGEHTAALIHPRLPAAAGDFELKYVFAGAMQKLGLQDEAIRVLRESLEEESEMTLEWRTNTHQYLDRLTGLRAEGEIELELHPNTDTLRRSIWVGDDQGPKVELIPGGVSVPVERNVKMQPAPGLTGSTGSTACYLHGERTELEPVSLGWFRVHEADFAAAEMPLLTVIANKHGRIEATARQKDRRLPVTWSLYRVPSVETEGK